MTDVSTCLGSVAAQSSLSFSDLALHFGSVLFCVKPACRSRDVAGAEQICLAETACGSNASIGFEQWSGTGRADWSRECA